MFHNYVKVQAITRKMLLHSVEAWQAGRKASPHYKLKYVGSIEASYYSEPHALITEVGVAAGTVAVRWGPEMILKVFRQC